MVAAADPWEEIGGFFGRVKANATLWTGVPVRVFVSTSYGSHPLSRYIA